MKYTLFVGAFMLTVMLSSSAFSAEWNHFTGLECFAANPSYSNCFNASNDFWITGRKNTCGTQITVLCPIYTNNWYASASNQVDYVSVNVGESSRAGTSCVLYTFNTLVPNPGNRQLVPDNPNGVWSWAWSSDIYTYETDSQGSSYATNFMIKCDLNDTKGVVSYDVTVK